MKTIFVYIQQDGLPRVFGSAQAAQLRAVEDNCILPVEGHYWDREGLYLDLYVQGSSRKVARVWECFVWAEE